MHSFQGVDQGGVCPEGLLSADLGACVADLLRRACGVLERDQVSARTFIEHAVAVLDGVLVPPVNLPGMPGAMVHGGLAPWQVKRVARYIEENLESAISVHALAEVCRRSTSHFSRVFKITFGELPRDYIVRQRLRKAQRMMLESEEPLSQIAVACGFADQSHFCRRFRHAKGTSPYAWRSEYRAGPQLLAAE